jgi:hypothetical protein
MSATKGIGRAQATVEGRHGQSSCVSHTLDVCKEGFFLVKEAKIKYNKPCRKSAKRIRFVTAFAVRFDVSM